jgi:hypothetical protein
LPFSRKFEAGGKTGGEKKAKEENRKIFPCNLNLETTIKGQLGFPLGNSVIRKSSLISYR